MRCIASVLFLAGAAALLAACAHAPSASKTAAAPFTLHEPLPGVFTAGQPDANEWTRLQRRGVRTVINLRLPQELPGRDEAAEVRAAGMVYIEIPVAGSREIDEANARKLHDALAAATGPVLIHCASGNRVGGLLALDQARFDHLDAQAAIELGRAAGMTGSEEHVKEVLGIAH